MYEVEVAATISGPELLRAKSEFRSDVSIALDNKAAIQASLLRTAGPGRYLTGIVHRSLYDLIRSIVAILNSSSDRFPATATSPRTRPPTKQ